MNKDSRTRRAFWRLLAGLLFALSVHTAAGAGAEDEDAPSISTGNAPPISTLLKEGWQIAGFSQALDNRSTFILFRHPDQAYLVQCRAGYDATRTPRTYSFCYRLE
jgi:hypothetical protein